MKSSCPTASWNRHCKLMREWKWKRQITFQYYYENSFNWKNLLEGSQEAPGIPGQPLLNHSLSQFHRQKPDLCPLLEEAVNQDVRVTSGWWSLRNFIWMEALSWQLVAHQTVTKHVLWCAECEGYGIYKNDLSPLKYLELVTFSSWHDPWHSDPRSCEFFAVTTSGNH